MPHDQLPGLFSTEYGYGFFLKSILYVRRGSCKEQARCSALALPVPLGRCWLQGALGSGVLAARLETSHM